MPAAVSDLSARASSTQLSPADRRLAMDTLAFVKDPAASNAMLGLAARHPMREMATVWLLNRMSNEWADHDLLAALKTAGIYDPATITLKELVVPTPRGGSP